MTTKKHSSGWSWPRRRPFLWWNYDLTMGLSVAWLTKQRRARFYGITIGYLSFGVTRHPVEPDRSGE